MSKPRSSEIQQAEKREAAARVQIDIANLDQLWCDDATFNTTENIILTKDQFLSRIKAGLLRYSKFDRVVSRITSRDGVAVATGLETVIPATGPDAGKAISVNYLHVWLKESGSWRLFARHASAMSKQEHPRRRLATT